MAARDFATFDDGQWPDVFVRLAGSAGDEGAVERLLEGVRERLGRGERFSILFDVSTASGFSLPTVYRVARFLEEVRPLIRERLRCSAIVVESAFVRSSINMLFSIRKPTRPNRVFGSCVEAVTWIRQHDDD